MSTADRPVRRRALANVGNSLPSQPTEARMCAGLKKRQPLHYPNTRPAPAEHPTAHPTTRKVPTSIPPNPRLPRLPSASTPLAHTAPVRARAARALSLESRVGAPKPERNVPTPAVQRAHARARPHGAPYSTTHPARRRPPPHSAALALPPPLALALREQRPVDRALAARDMWPAGPAGPARRAWGEPGRLAVEQQLPTPPSSMRVRGPGVHALLSGAAASRPIFPSSPPWSPPPPLPPPSSSSSSPVGMPTSLASLMRSLSGRRGGARAGTEEGRHAGGAGCSFTMELDESSKEPLLGLTLSGLGAPTHPASPDVDPDFTPLAVECGEEWGTGRMEAVRGIEVGGRGGGGAAVAERDEVERAMERVCEACMGLCREWEALDVLLGRADMAK